MKKLLILFALILVSCSENNDSSDIAHTLSIENTYDRIRFETVSLPNYTFDVTSQVQTFTLDKGMPEGVNDFRVSLAYYCQVGGVNRTTDLTVNFYEGKTTYLKVDRITTCTPSISTEYR